jgi:hypothetical protein
MRLLFILLAILIGNLHFVESKDSAPMEGTICFFSLNNVKEEVLAQKFITQINKQTGSKFKVKEYMASGSNPEESFKQMVASGEKCDDLVISGHHTGAWLTPQPDIKLTVEFLEKLSCDPNYKDWFANIKSLHLQGCRTLGVGKITKIEAGNQEFSADHHTSRVNGAIMDGTDDLPQDVSGMNHEFTNTLDQDNPLSSRYLRVFPKATVFGWTRSAPGENSKSENSLLYHITHMARLTNALNRDALINPLQDAFTPNEAIELSTAVLDLLQKPDLDRCQKTSMLAWEKQGREKNYGFNNPDYLTLPAYFSAHDTKKEADAKVDLINVSCQLRTAETQNDRITALKVILSKDTYIAANLNALIELTENKGIPSQDKKEMLSIMKNNASLKSFIGNKLNPGDVNRRFQVGLFAKIDYYTFYKKVYERSPDIEKIIEGESLTYLSKPYTSEPSSVSYRDLRDFKATLTSSLAKNNFVTPEFMRKLADIKTSEAIHMYRTIYNKSHDPEILSLPRVW